MLDWDTWQEVWATLRSNKLRALLTALGVFWGVFMLILMLGIGNGLERGVIRNLAGLTNYSVYLWPQRTSLPFRGLQPGRYVHFTEADIGAVARAEGVEYVAPRLQLGNWHSPQNVSYGIKKANFTVMGDSPEFAYVEPLILESGRVIIPRDDHFNIANDYDWFSGIYASSRKLVPWQETDLYFLARDVGQHSRGRDRLF